MLDFLNDAIEEGIKSQLPKEYKDWKYRDLPKMTPEFFDEFVSIVGEENIY